MFKKILVIFNGLLLAVSCFGQNSLAPVVVAAGGGFFTNGGYTLSYTFGELSVKTFSVGSNILTEGFQQSFPIIKDSLPPYDDIRYFPNPVKGTLTVQFLQKEQSSFTVGIYNILGKLIEYREVHNISGTHNENFNVAHYGSGIYLIKIQSDDGKPQRIIKIEKI